MLLAAEAKIGHKFIITAGNKTPHAAFRPQRMTAEERKIHEVGVPGNERHGGETWYSDTFTNENVPASITEEGRDLLHESYVCKLLSLTIVTNHTIFVQLQILLYQRLSIFENSRIVNL